ncbi:MAG: hypothetical protein IPL01_24320 [Acidobacteria bacterium]|nr:hypothetical protein [Acidobacteriota bacterium]
MREDILRNASGSDSFDSNFGRNKRIALQASAGERAARGYADTVFVADPQRSPFGIHHLSHCIDAKGRIGLVGVSPDARSTGLGISLNELLKLFLR